MLNFNADENVNTRHRVCKKLHIKCCRWNLSQKVLKPGKIENVCWTFVASSLKKISKIKFCIPCVKHWIIITTKILPKRLKYRTSLILGLLILNPAIIFNSIEPILQYCQFCVFLVENYIFEILKNF